MNDRQKTAFIEAVQCNRDSMYRTAYAILGRSADAEDAVSCAVETTWRHLKRIRNPEALKTYLMRCCINAARKELRRRKRFASEEALGDMPDAGIESTKIHEILAPLDKKSRIPLLLKFSEGYNESEIAAILHLPRGTVSSRISRALSRLRDEFKEEV